MYTLFSVNDKCIRIIGMNYAPANSFIVYTKDYIVGDRFSYIEMASDLALMFTSFIWGYNAILPSLHFKTKKDFECFEVYIKLFFANLRHNK